MCKSVRLLFIFFVFIPLFTKTDCLSEEISLRDLPNFSGYIVTKKGETIIFDKVAFWGKVFCFRYGNEQNIACFKTADVCRITFGEESRSVRVELKNGAKMLGGFKYGSWTGFTRSLPCAERELFGTFVRKSKKTYGIRSKVCFGPGVDVPCLTILEYDAINKKEKRKSYFFEDISMIVIGQESGRFRSCPHCKAILPATYWFCPYDGGKTIWSEISGEHDKKVLTTAKETDLIEAVLNASLARSGIDPLSKEAQKAKEFGKLWLNPLADPREIHKKLDEFRNDILNRNQ